jgi:foldase protein PrsA
VNNSKKLRTKKVKKDRLIEQKPITSISKRWIIASAILVVVLIGALLFDQFYKRTIMTIDDDKYYMDDLSYYFYGVESTYDYYDQMFGGGGTYWNMTYDETSGATTRDIAKQEAVESALYTEILYKEAIAEGYSLTDEENKAVSDNVENMLSESLSEAVIEKNDFTKEYLTEVVGKSTLVQRYRQDKVDSFDIDDEGIKAGVDFEEYKQYDIEYLFISTKNTDEDGNSVDMTEDEKTAAFDKINAVYESAKTTEDWSTLVSEDEEELTYEEGNFLGSGTTYSEDFQALMMAMENDAVSEIYEDEDGYYIVRMVNNNSTESYDNAVEEAITTAEDEAFSELYSEIITKHEYTTNDNALKSLTMGSITLAD